MSAAALAHGPRPADAGATLVFEDRLATTPALALLDEAARRLPGGAGTLVIVDAFAFVPPVAPGAALPLRDHLVALAQRQGWALARELRLPAGLRPGAEDLARLLDDGAVAPTAHGRQGYALLRFERREVPEDRLAAIGAAESADMRVLFEHVFGHPMSAAEWAWKYGAGRGRAVGLYRGGRLVAHYGGLTRPVLGLGPAPVDACQVCDVMVDARANAAIVRKGPLHQVAASFLEAQIGYAQPHLVGFGFPSLRHLRLAERLGLYAAVDEVVRLSWPARAEAPRGLVAEALTADSLAPGGAREGVVARLWRRMAAALPDAIVGVRDPSWLRYRYLTHPTRRYELQLVRRRWSRRALGVIALRRHDDRLELLDLVAPPAAFAELVAFARRQAHDAGLPRLDCWVSTSHRRCFDAADPAATTVHDLGIALPANVHTAGPAPEALRGRWFVLGGDADFT